MAVVGTGKCKWHRAPRRPRECNDTEIDNGAMAEKHRRLLTLAIVPQVQMSIHSLLLASQAIDPDPPGLVTSVK